jgi:hypothetical protein
MRTLASIIAIAIAISFASPARADDAPVTHQNAYVLPSMTIDTGIGAGASNFATTTFTYGSYKISGANLGLSRSAAFLLSSSMRLYPFSIRNFGFFSTVEMLMLNGSGERATPAGTVGGSNDDGPSYYSVEVGPEVQERFGSMVVRVAGLVGWRDVSFDHYDALDVRAGGRVQIDYTFLHTLTFGAFGGLDALPTFGWTTGVSFSCAFF